MQDYYSVLGVSRNASKSEIKSGKFSLLGVLADYYSLIFFSILILYIELFPFVDMTIMYCFLLLLLVLNISVDRK